MHSPLIFKHPKSEKDKLGKMQRKLLSFFLFFFFKNYLRELSFFHFDKKNVVSRRNEPWTDFASWIILFHGFRFSKLRNQNRYLQISKSWESETERKWCLGAPSNSQAWSNITKTFSWEFKLCTYIYETTFSLQFLGVKPPLHITWSVRMVFLVRFLC